jgi:hypothetical protein
MGVAYMCTIKIDVYKETQKGVVLTAETTCKLDCLKPGLKISIMK